MQSTADTDVHMDNAGLDDPLAGKYNTLHSPCVYNANVMPSSPESAHRLRRNPAVTIEDWPDPDLSPEASDDEELAGHLNEPIDGPDRDPEFIERAQSPGLDPIDEPNLTDDEVRRLLEADLGDLADEEWSDICKLSLFIAKWLYALLIVISQTPAI
jgi:hypothetical protein